MDKEKADETLKEKLAKLATELVDKEHRLFDVKEKLDKIRKSKEELSEL